MDLGLDLGGNSCPSRSSPPHHCDFSLSNKAPARTRETCLLVEFVCVSSLCCAQISLFVSEINPLAYAVYEVE
jgi:hypothetical protein